MGQTVDDAITRILTRLQGRTRLPFDRLNGAIANGTTESITCEFGDRNIVNGTRLEIGYELMQVYDDTSSPTYSVLRGLDEGAAASSHADDSLVRIDPWIYRQDALETMREVIEDLPDVVYQTTTTTLTMASDTPYANLTGASGLEVLWARAERDPETASLEPYLKVPLRVIENDAFTDGWAIQIDRGASYYAAQTLEVTYAYRFDTSTFTSATDLEADVGINAGFLPTIHAGTTHRLLLGEEFQRNQLQAQPQGRRSEDVPPGVHLEVAREWERKFEQGLAREASRLRRVHPIKDR